MRQLIAGYERCHLHSFACLLGDLIVIDHCMQSYISKIWKLHYAFMRMHVENPIANQMTIFVQNAAPGVAYAP